jgi:hypothetical protein
LAADIQVIIGEARTQKSAGLTTESLQAVETHRAVFDRVRIATPRATPVNIFVYHYPVPAEASRISYADIRMDQGAFDYDRIIEHCLIAALSRGSDEHVYLVTSPEFGRQFRHPRLAVVELAVDPIAPMYERVRAMAAYMRSTAFDADTVFLDGDAFANRSLRPVFQCPFDVAVTYRGDAGLMPINEGVIFAQHTRREAAAAFFDSYVATYDRLIGHPPIVAHYGDIRRWRGGQLSLNALTCPLGAASEVDEAEVFGAQVRYLPCHGFNFSMEAGQKYSAEELDTKYVLHLKGPRKSFLDSIAKYQLSRIQDRASVRSGETQRIPQAI